MWRRGSPRSRNSTPSSWNSSITSTGWSLEIYVSFKRARRRRPFLDYGKISLRKRALKNDIDLKLRFFSVLTNRFLAKEITFSERKISQPFELNCIDFKLILKKKNPYVYMLLTFFLDIRDDSLSGTELTSKLEPAFLAGLRCNQPPIRQKFVEVRDISCLYRNIRSSLYSPFHSP